MALRLNASYRQIFLGGIFGTVFFLVPTIAINSQNSQKWDQVQRGSIQPQPLTIVSTEIVGDHRKLSLADKGGVIVTYRSVRGSNAHLGDSFPAYPLAAGEYLILYFDKPFPTWIVIVGLIVVWLFVGVMCVFKLLRSSW